VFGVIYSSFRNETGEIEKLPILQLPEALRSTDPNLIYKPHYRLRKGEYTVQIGPKVFSFANIEEYVGWNTFSTEIGNRFEKLFKLGIIKSIGRFGLRYINLFSDMNIYEKSTLKIHLGESNQYGNQINLTMAMPMGGFLSKLVMVNGITGGALERFLLDLFLKHPEVLMSTLGALRSIIKPSDNGGVAYRNIH